MTRGLGAAGVLAAALAAAGCATIATGGSGEQKVTVQSDTPGAAVFVDGHHVGTAPVTVVLGRRDSHQVEVSAPGHETARLAVNSQFNPWVIGNVVFGGVIGVAVDLVTGATSTLSPDTLTVRLRRLEPQPLPPPAASPSPAAPPTPR
jgi:hypothetical protein